MPSLGGCPCRGFRVRDGIFWLPAGKDATERLPWLLEHLAVQLVLSSGAGENKLSHLGGIGARGKQASGFFDCPKNHRRITWIQ